MSDLKNFQTPYYLLNEDTLREKANDCLNFPNAYGLVVRYAMKANPNKNILKIFDEMGVEIDASSEYEVYRAISAWIDAKKIQLTSQEVSKNLKELLDTGIIYNATSLHQMREFGRVNAGWELSIRINPGLGSGGNNRTNVWGPSSSFGIWYEQIEEAKQIAKEFNLTISKIHTHI